MNNSEAMLSTTRIVARALALLSNRLRVIAMALAFATPLMGATPAQAQCAPSWAEVGSMNIDYDVRALAVLPGGDVIVGGFFTTAGGVWANNIARYNPSTGVWSALGTGTNFEVTALAVLPGGDVIVGGIFTNAGGVPARGIARYNPSTGVWSALGSGIQGTRHHYYSQVVYALAVLPDGDVIVGGYFTTAGGVSANNIARYNPSTGVWSTLGSGTNNFINGHDTIYALAVLPGGDMIVGGYFDYLGDVPTNGMARYNPATGAWTALLGGGTSGGVRTMAVLPDGDIIAGGGFINAGGGLANNIARYNPSTGFWSPLGTGTNGSVIALAVLPGGDVIAGGDFTSAGGVPANRIARYNPSTGVWSALNEGVNGGVRALSILPGGDLIAGGWFTRAGGVDANRIARYFPGIPAPTITTQPVSSNVCPNLPATFSITPAGTGPFTFQWRKNYVAIDTTTNPSADTATLALANLQPSDSGVYDCVVSSPCGSVTSIPATLSVSLCPCGLSDIAGPGQANTPDRQLTADDIIVFLAYFFIGDQRADIAGPGQSTTPDGQFTADDIILFLNRFFAGC